MSKGQWESIGGQRGPESGFIAPEDAFIVEIEDKSHPKHKRYSKRLDPERPDIIALAESMYELGWPKGSIVWLYRAGDRAQVAAGRRRITAARIANARRKADGKPVIRVPVMMTNDPGMTEDIENAGRVDLPPLWVARDYVAALDECNGDERKAAARIGITLAYAHQLEACLSLPLDIRQKVNDREIPVDVAARMAKKGSDAARAVVEQSSDESGKVNADKARAAARELPKRAKTRPARVLESVEAELLAMSSDHADGRLSDAAAVLAWARGVGEAPAWLAKAIESAEGARSGKRTGQKAEAAE